MSDRFRLHLPVRFPVRTAVVAALLVLAGSFAVGTPAARAQADTTVPVVQGPITGPGPMYSSLAAGPSAGTSLTDFNYVTDEYFVSGVADGAPYQTRIVVRRPALAEKFSGLIVAEPMHFSGAALICQYAQLGIAMNGDGCLEIDSESLDVPILQGFNAARYGSLSVGATQTNAILAQVGRLVRSNGPGSPFGGLQVRNVVLSGISESSNIVRTYMGAYDTGSADFRMADGSPIYQGFLPVSTLGPAPLPVTNVPTIQMPTQSEVTAGASSPGESSSFQRPDSDSPSNPFRIYEVAGMSHADVRGLPNNQGCTFGPFSQFPVGAMVFMGLNHLLNWVANGIAPPHAPYIAVNPGDQVIDGTRVTLDQYGNATGGVRTPYLDEPIYRYTIPDYNIPGVAGPSFLCSLAGFQTPLPQSALQGLYANEGQYISAVNVRLGELTREGWWPEEYTHLFLRADALAYAKEFLSPAA